MPFPAIPTQVTCPRCKKSFLAEVHTIIDVGEQPELKEQFLRGQINYVSCPQCGGGGALNTPLLYHDPAKDLLVSYIPPELGMSAEQQEKFVGSLVNTVMSALPAEKRKAYFLQPKTVLSIEGLYDMIMEADGISKEALEEQRAKLRLVNTLLAAVEDDKTLDKLVAEHKAELDYTFFLLLADAIDAYTQDGNTEHAQAVTALREKLLARVTPAMPAAPKQAANYDELIDLLRQAKAGAPFSSAVLANRGRLDYGFFQALTAKIEAAQATGDADTAQALTDLREQILAELDKQEERVRAAQDKASLLIMELAEAQDIEAAVRQHRAEINEIVVSLLARYEAAAREQKNVARAEKMSKILDTVTRVFEEELPPDVRLVNRLLRAEFPEGTNAVLEEHRGLLSDDLLKTIDEYIASLDRGRDKPLAEHLRQVRPQIVAKMQILRA